MKRLFFGLLLTAVVVSAQKREELQSIQRDVAQLQEQVKQLQRSQDERMAAMQSLLQQAVDASGKSAASMSTMQRDIDVKLSAQGDKLVGPVANLGTKIDQMSDDLRSLSTNMAELLRRMSAMDAKLSDVSSAIRTMSAPAPPPAGITQSIPGGSAASSGPPPGVSPETSYQASYRDYSSGKYDLALQEFSEYVKNFPQTEAAPTAQYYMGYIYFNAEQYKDAIQAFDAVLERYPENPKTPDALYYKAVSLMKSDRRTEAGTEFKEFLRRYPRNEHVSNAHSNLRVLGLERAPVKKR